MFTRSLSLAIVFSVAALCSAQAQQPAPSADPSRPILQMAQRFENNLMSLAQAMPADKYNFAPSSGLFKPDSPAQFATVRTFAGQLTHAAGEPFRLLAPYGVKPDAAIDVKTIDSLTSKDEVRRRSRPPSTTRTRSSPASLLRMPLRRKARAA